MMRPFKNVPHRTNSAAKRGGFTLIELLVVISIIALLIGILLPALSSARAAGRAIACMSNMRQFSVASAAYQGDYDGVTFGYRQYIDRIGQSSQYPYYATYIPFVYMNGAYAVMQCPSDDLMNPLTNAPRLNFQNANTGARDVAYSYAFNNDLPRKAEMDGPYTPNATNAVSFSGRFLDAVRTPSRLAFMYETTSFARMQYNSPATYYRFQHGKGDGQNVPFVDGHAGMETYDFVPRHNTSPSEWPDGWDVFRFGISGRTSPLLLN